MRTTVNIDDELCAQLRKRARERRVPFTVVVNDALREALSPSGREPVVWPVHRLGRSLSPEEVKSSLRELEAEEDRAKLR